MKTNIDDTTLQAAINEAFRSAKKDSYLYTSELYNPAWISEAPARLALAKAFLARLPEPNLADELQRLAWATLPEGVRECWRSSAAAVLAANGRASLEAAIARMESVPADELEKAYWNGQGAVGSVTACERIRARLIAAARGPINLEAAVGASPGSFAQTCDDSKTGELPASSVDTDLRSEWIKLLGYSSSTGAFYRASKDSKFYSASTEQSFQAWLSKQKPVDQPAEIPWVEWHGGPCPLKDEEVEEFELKFRSNMTTIGTPCPSNYFWEHQEDYTDIVAYRILKWRERPDAEGDYGLKTLLQKAEAELAKAREAIALLQEQETELAEAHEYLDQLGFLRGNGEDEFTLKGRLLTPRSLQSLSRLRPLSEAGPVPAGCVRLYFAHINGEWSPGIPQKCQGDTHYADILLLPEASQPAVEPKVGDVVTLKSGGTKMTVVQVDGTDCRTMWFNGSAIDAGDFYNATLQPA